MLSNTPYRLFALVVSLSYTSDAMSQNATISRNSTALNSTQNTRTANYSCYPKSDFTIINPITLTLCSIGFISNGLLLILIAKDPLKTLRKSSWVTITNLASADLFTIILTMPFCGNADEIFITRARIKAAHVLLYTGYTASFLLLLLFAFERYIAVKYPLTKHNYLTKRRIYGACFACWVIAVTLSVVSQMVDNPWSPIGHIIVLEVVVIFMIVLKILLIKTICVKQPYEFEERKTQRRNIVATLVALIVILILTALPYFIALQVSDIAEILYECNDGNVVMFNFQNYYLPVGTVNFVVNPFVYGWRLPDYRLSFRALICGKGEQCDEQPAVKKYQSTVTAVYETRC